MKPLSILCLALCTRSRRIWPMSLWTEGLEPIGVSVPPSVAVRQTLAVAKNDEITLVVQVNGKVRDKLTAPADLSQDDLQAH